MTAGSKASLTINKFEVTSNVTGTSFDIGKGDPNNGIPGKTPIIEYRESILTPFVEISTVIVDEGTAIPDGGDGYTSVMEGLKIEGGEVVKFKITDGVGNTIDLTGGNDLRLNQPGSTLSSRKGTMTQLTITSKELLDNELLENEVTQKLDGKINEAVSRILRNDLKSSRSIVTDESLEGATNAFGGARKPFEVINDLQPLAIPTGVTGGNDKCAGYLFWQTSRAIYFKSINKMFEGSEVAKFIFDNKVSGVPNEFDDKIIEYEIKSGCNVTENLKNGAYCTEMHLEDPHNLQVDKRLQLASPQGGNGKIAGTKLPMSSSPYFSKPSLRLHGQVPYGGFARGDSLEKQQEKSTDAAWSPQSTIQQSRQSFRQKFTLSAEITIPCNLSLHAGDLIYCKFPEISQKRTLRQNRQTTGIYMISDLCHYSNSTQAFTKLRLIRDSFGTR